LQEVVPFAVLAPGGQSGNFWIHPRISPFLEAINFTQKHTKNCAWGRITEKPTILLFFLVLGRY